MTSVLIHQLGPLAYHPGALRRVARREADVLGVGVVLAEHVGAEGEEIAGHEVGVHQLVEIAVLGLAAVLLHVTAEGVERGVGLEEVGRAVGVDVPVFLPVVGEHGLDVIEHAGLDVHGHAAVIGGAVHIEGVGVPGALGYLGRRSRGSPWAGGGCAGSRRTA